MYNLFGDIMSVIKVMSENLANKIAAGEVVEKCVSIVKELVENSVDALSTEIKIELKEAGLREIKVIDNGIGMDEDDAKNAFLRHATSKLYSDDDLFSIKTLGFRGEALPSIAAVSEVVLKTCQNDVGTMVHIKGGKILEVKSDVARVGTSICVSNLFYNTPARLKHLSSVNSELSNIVEYVNKMALSHSNIRFILINDDREILNTDGKGNLLRVIKSIYGVDVAKKMIAINTSNNDYNVEGYVSLPEVNRASRNHISIIVNGRVVRNSRLNKVINDAYAGYKFDNRYPIVVLVIKVDPNLIDVNIHPAKLEVKFSNFEELEELVSSCIRESINNKLLIPKIEIKERVVEKYENLNLDLERNIVKEPDVDYNARLFNKINMNDDNDEDIVNDSSEDIVNDYVENVEASKKIPELYPVGLALGTYIICQNELGIYLIDQHAAQERINYEKYLELLSHPNSDVVKPLFPIVIEYPLNEFLNIKEKLDIIKDLNIDIEEFGTSSYRISSYPTWFGDDYASETIKNIIDVIINNRDFSIAKYRDHLAASVACKASVKANTNISIEAMESIIDDLRKCNNPYNCPHGRPTIIHFSCYEIEKMFKRSV